MTKPGTIAKLFEQEPTKWGLRGDPHLWREMRAHFEQTPLPDSTEELEALIKAAFESLTGYPISHPENFFIKRLDHGGMSGGVVDPKFWREQVMPMMRARFL
jgi:molybdenum cofactor cytidylyltransferase